MFVLGDHNVCEHGRLRIWPERGLIHIEDSTTNGYEVISVRTALHRMKALSDMLANSREEMKRSGFMEPDEYNRIQKMLETMCDVVRQSQEQGMPTDASARRDLLRRRPRSIVMPSAGSSL